MIKPKIYYRNRLMHIKLKEEIIPVMVRQSKTYWTYKMRQPKKGETFNSPPVMDNVFFNTEEGKEYIDALKEGKTIYL